MKSALAKAARASTAEGLFEAARKLKDARKDEQAYPQFKTVASDYPETPAGAKAADIVKAYETDTAFIQRINESAAATKATSMIKLAQSYASAGRNDLARRKYQDVVDQFPGTSYAEQAQGIGRIAGRVIPGRHAWFAGHGEFFVSFLRARQYDLMLLDSGSAGAGSPSAT